MGLAASQARYLALTARKSDLEYQSQTINTRRIQLSYKTAEIAQAYSEGMNNQRIKVSHIEGTGTDSKTVWEELTFQNLINNKSGGSYMLIGVNGTPLQPAPYVMESTVDGKKYTPVAVDGTTAKNSTKIQYKDVASGAYIASDISTTPWSASSTATTSSTATSSTNPTSEKVSHLKYNSDTKTNELVQTDNPAKAGSSTAGSMPTDVWKYQEKDGKYYLVNTWKLNPNLTTAEYNNIKAFDATNGTTYATTCFTEEDNVSRNYKVNPQYENGEGLDIQTLLTSGKAQIVTKAFYDYLVGNWGYNYSTGITLDQFKKAMDTWTSTEDVNCGYDSVVEWEADGKNSAFQQRAYTEDDAYVLAKYEADTAKIQAQDKILETQEKNIETQHKAIETELDGLKKVIENNIDKSFKMFS